jgi:hypothetical protein
MAWAGAKETAVRIWIRVLLLSVNADGESQKRNECGNGVFHLFAERSYPPMTGGWAVVGVAAVI